MKQWVESIFLVNCIYIFIFNCYFSRTIFFLLYSIVTQLHIHVCIILFPHIRGLWNWKVWRSRTKWILGLEEVLFHEWYMVCWKGGVIDFSDLFHFEAYLMEIHWLSKGPYRAASSESPDVCFPNGKSWNPIERKCFWLTQPLLA